MFGQNHRNQRCASPRGPGLVNDPAISHTPTANKNTTIQAAADSNMWITLVLGRFWFLTQE